MNDRSYKILNLCCDAGKISIKELAKNLSVSEITIRKDLEELIEKGLVSNHKGIIELNSSENGILPYSLRTTINIEKKIELSKYVASLIKDNQIIFLDGGSTLINIVDYITTKNNVFVTTGLQMAQRAAAKGLRVYLLPGFVNPQTNAVLGTDGLSHIENMAFDYAFVGASGISRFYKFATNSPDSAAIKRKAIEKANVAYVVADDSKFSVLGFNSFADFDKVKLISNAKPDVELPGLQIIIPETFRNKKENNQMKN